MSGSNPFRRSARLGEGGASAPIGREELIARAGTRFPALDTGKCHKYFAYGMAIGWLIQKE